MEGLTIRDIFPMRLKHYMKVNGKKRNDLVEELGLKYSTIRDWEKGITVPRMDKVELLAEYFGCENSDLLEIKKEPVISDELTATKQELHDFVDGLSETEAAVLLASLKSMLGKL